LCDLDAGKGSAGFGVAEELGDVAETVGKFEVERTETDRRIGGGGGALILGEGIDPEPSSDGPLGVASLSTTDSSVEFSREIFDLWLRRRVTGGFGGDLRCVTLK
jgi:hypothetical protein